MLKKKIGIVLAGLVSGTLGGGLVGGLVGAATASVEKTYSVNELGLTYGSSAFAGSPEGEPDLILVLATNGSVGYAYKSDLDGEMPSSPEEAERWHLTQPSSRMVPVYEADGVTVIGEFEIASGGHARPEGIQ